MNHKKLSFSLLCIATALTSQSAHAETPSSNSEHDWELVWSDEFNYTGLPDPDKWNYDVGASGWGNNELQFYTEKRRENARVEEGKLIIEARKEPYQGAEYTSARLVTKGKQEWTYGRFEIRAKLPDGLGTWPAIWMLPVEWNLGDGGWPDVGEIDIMEHVGYDEGTVHASAHSKAYQWRIGTQKTATIEVPDATTAFHTYTLEWTEDVMRAYVDDTLYFTYENEGTGWETWPYQRDYYLILNIAFGGDWGGSKGIDPECLPGQMEVDFVRVYKQSE